MVLHIILAIGPLSSGIHSNTPNPPSPPEHSGHMFVLKNWNGIDLNNQFWREEEMSSNKTKRVGHGLCGNIR